ncbi:hypothetical protein SAMN05216474_1278 [Lishizhenia tianjinensis]|uniref:Translation initiation factor IF-2, N-terminal region n=1 Tax=Lishizhenia tianjinensis TaxID=477690 RepID=A0A1I6YXZ1_9FLAO|nr:hypothetical protein [Lishizhenia tianjinensis]SFT55326.1 hypothetical protein SAMN05216474_1278 [Lishizhenia tianjinensis]
MRLGQLARRLSIKTDKIVKFLEETKDTKIGEHPNTKIPDEFVDDVINHFKPEPIKEMVAALNEIPEESLQENLVEENLEPKEEQEIEVENKAPLEIIAEQEEPLNDTSDESAENPHSENTTPTENNPEEESPLEEEELNIVDGVIKAPKQELGGVKVIGKIDLPEPKVETPEEAISSEETPTTERSEEVEVTKVKKQVKRKTPEQKRKQQQERRRKQELAEQKAKEERKKEIEQQKRKEHYLKQLEEQKAKAPAKKKKKAKSQPKKKVKQEAPKGIWKKFLYWLNDKN